MFQFSGETWMLHWVLYFTHPGSVTAFEFKDVSIMIAYSFSEQMLSILSDVSFTMLNIWFSSSPRIYNWVSILHKYSRKYITIHLNQRHSKVFKVQVILNLMGNNVCCENVWDSESLVATCIFLNCNSRP